MSQNNQSVAHSVEGSNPRKSEELLHCESPCSCRKGNDCIFLTVYLWAKGGEAVIKNPLRQEADHIPPFMAS